MNNKYGGVIWTNHALDRLRERGIKQGDAWATFKRPDSSKHGKKKGVYVYYKTSGRAKIEVVAKQNSEKKWVILSVWSKITRNNKRKDRPFFTVLKNVLKL